MTDRFDLSDDDEQVIAAFMSQVAGLPAEWQAADPRQMWWRAQLLRRWDAERRAQLPLDVMDVVQIVTAAAAAALLVVWSLPSVVRFL